MSRLLRIMTATLVVGFTATLAAQDPIAPAAQQPSPTDPLSTNPSTAPAQEKAPAETKPSVEAKAGKLSVADSACEDGVCESDCCPGMPILSRIPYVSRLFKNVGMGHPHALRFTIQAETLAAEAQHAEEQDAKSEEPPRTAAGPRFRIQLRQSRDEQGAIGIEAEVVGRPRLAQEAVKAPARDATLHAGPGFAVAKDHDTIKVVRVAPHAPAGDCACGADCACCASAVKLPSLADLVGLPAVTREGSACAGPACSACPASACTSSACSSAACAGSCGVKAVCTAAGKGACGGVVCTHSGCAKGECAHDACTGTTCAEAGREVIHPVPPLVAWRDPAQPHFAIATFAAPPFTGMPFPAMPFPGMPVAQPAHAGCPFKELHERLVAAETENAHLKGKQEGRESLTAALLEASVENARLHTQVEVLGELVELKEQHAKEKQELIESIVEMQQEFVEQLTEVRVENAQLKLAAEVAEERRALFAQFAEAQVEMNRKAAELQTRAAQVEQQLHAIEQVRAENAALKARLAELTSEKSESRPVSNTASRPTATEAK